MRGSYNYTEQDRQDFIRKLKELCERWNTVGGIDLCDTNLNLSNCQDLLEEELGYDHVDSDTNGWVMEFWWVFEAEGLPKIIVSGCGYTADLSIRFYGVSRGIDIDVAPLMAKMKEVWGV